MRVARGKQRWVLRCKDGGIAVRSVFRVTNQEHKVSAVVNVGDDHFPGCHHLDNVARFQIVGAVHVVGAKLDLGGNGREHWGVEDVGVKVSGGIRLLLEPIVERRGSGH